MELRFYGLELLTVPLKQLWKNYRCFIRCHLHEDLHAPQEIPYIVTGCIVVKRENNKLLRVAIRFPREWRSPTPYVVSISSELEFAFTTSDGTLFQLYSIKRLPTQ